MRLFCNLQIFLVHVDRQVSGGVFQTVAGNVTVCKFRSSIIVTNLSEGAEAAPDMSPPRLPPERPPMVFTRGETMEPSTARPKVRTSRRSRPREAEEVASFPTQD